MKPYSDNIVFFDSEFSSLDPYIGEFLSIGLIKPDGEELYLELRYDGECDPWVKENILPTLNKEKVTREEAKRRIREFLGKDRPYLVSYVNQFDAIYWYKLFGVDEQPAFWIPIDFASILFGLGIEPRMYMETDGDPEGLAVRLGIDVSQYNLHNALDDARLLKDVYIRFYDKLNS